VGLPSLRGIGFFSLFPRRDGWLVEPPFFASNNPHFPFRAVQTWIGRPWSTFSNPGPWEKNSRLLLPLLFFCLDDPLFFLPPGAPFPGRGTVRLSDKSRPFGAIFFLDFSFFRGESSLCGFRFLLIWLGGRKRTCLPCFGSLLLLSGVIWAVPAPFLLPWRGREGVFVFSF